MRTLSRSNTRSILIASALILCAAPAFAQQGGGGRGGSNGPAGGAGGGGADIYSLILKDPAKPSVICPGIACFEVKPRPRPRPIRFSKRSKPTEACRSTTPQRDWSNDEWIAFQTCSARRS